MATVVSDHILDGCSPAVEMCANVQPTWIPVSSPRAIEDNKSATQIDKISQESSNSISKDEWLISVGNYVDDTTDKPRIRRISSLLRDKPCNEECYDPLVVSIGPYHHGKQKLDAFEKLKIPAAREFVRACGNQVSIKQLCEEVKKVDESVRKCYERGSTEEYNDESFTKMMLLDACFVLQFMSIFVAKNNYANGTDMEQDEVDPLQPWSCFHFFARFTNEIEGATLIQNFLNRKAAIMPPQESTCTNAVKKFVQRMMGCSLQKNKKWKIDMNACHPHLLDITRKQLIGSFPEEKKKKFREQLVQSSPEDKIVNCHSYRSVMELKSTGIHFRPSQTNDVTDVKFKSHFIHGTLTLPPLVVDDSTKSLLLNLEAYEMCPHGPSVCHIMSYISLMDSFIDRADDVKELRKRGILVNGLGSDKKLAKLFNKISNELVPDFCGYEDVQRQTENHYKSQAHVWMAEWIHDHFRSPWAFLAFLGAIFVIALAMVQTYFTVFPRKPSRK